MSRFSNKFSPRFAVGVCAVLFALTVSGCTISFGGQQTDTTAGVFKSDDKAENWNPANMFIFSGGIGSIAGVNVIDLQFDPQDRNAIYLNSNNSGLLFTYDGGTSWQKAFPLGNNRVEDVAVDPRNKCVIYTAIRNTILKSVDCSRTYDEVYIDTRADKTIITLAIDTYNNLIVYAGNNAGDILKSIDGGTNWQVIHRVERPIKELLINPKDTRIIYAATVNDGIFKSTNSGASWNDVNENLREFPGAFNYKDMFFDQTQTDALILVSRYGLLRSNDGGVNWEGYQLITPPNSVDIYAAAMSPASNQEIYYVTASTFYKTFDGGRNWITTRLPSGALPSTLLIDPVQTNVIYMGMFNQPK